MDQKFTVAVRLPGQKRWTLHSDPEGEELCAARQRLTDCVKSYGSANSALYLVVRFDVEVEVSLEGE